MADYRELCEQIIEKSGGRDNIKGAFHCMTRLRLTVDDNSKVDIDGIKAIPKVLGAQYSGDQFQVIIGPTVGQIYKDFCEITGLEPHKAVDENLDAHLTEGKEKTFQQGLPSAALDYLSGSVAPILPIMLEVQDFFRMFCTFWIRLLNVLPDDSLFMQTINAIKYGFSLPAGLCSLGRSQKTQYQYPDGSRPQRTSSCPRDQGNR